MVGLSSHKGLKELKSAGGCPPGGNALATAGLPLQPGCGTSPIARHTHQLRVLLTGLLLQTAAAEILDSGPQQDVPGNSPTQLSVVSSQAHPSADFGNVVAPLASAETDSMLLFLWSAGWIASSFAFTLTPDGVDPFVVSVLIDSYDNPGREMDSTFVIHDSRDWSLNPAQLEWLGSLGYAVRQYDPQRDSWQNALCGWLPEITPREEFWCDTAVPTPLSRPQTFSSVSAWPNPFNPATSVRFDLSTPGPVGIQVHNIRGEEVISRDLGPHAAGTALYQLSLAGHPAGTYFLTLRSGGDVHTTPVSFIK